MPAFMGNHCIQFLFCHHINQAGSDSYKNLCIAKGPCVRIRVHREIEFRLFNPQLLTNRWQTIIQFRQLIR